MLFFTWGGEYMTHDEPKEDKIKILSEYIIGFSEWLRVEGILK